VFTKKLKNAPSIKSCIPLLSRAAGTSAMTEVVEALRSVLSARQLHGSG